MKSLFVIVNPKPTGVKPDVVVFMQARTYEDAQAAVWLACRNPPPGYRVDGWEIMRVRNATTTGSNGRRRRVRIVLTKTASERRAENVQSLRKLFVPVWEVAQGQEPSPATPRTCERPSASIPTAKS